MCVGGWGTCHRLIHRQMPLPIIWGWTQRYRTREACLVSQAPTISLCYWVPARGCVSRNARTARPVHMEMGFWWTRGLALAVRWFSLSLPPSLFLPLPLFLSTSYHRTGTLQVLSLNLTVEQTGFMGRELPWYREVSGHHPWQWGDNQDRHWEMIRLLRKGINKVPKPNMGRVWEGQGHFWKELD